VAIPNAIAATGQAIVALIAGAMPHEELAATQFELYQAMDFQGPTLPIRKTFRVGMFANHHSHRLRRSHVVLTQAGG
jgi:hypothetical protein